MKQNILIFVSGLVVGVFFTAATIVLREIGQGFSQWGATEVFDDAAVRARIQESGIILPNGSRDLYFASSGFRDHEYWIKFSVPKELVWRVVEDSIKMQKLELVQRFPEGGMPEEAVQLKHQKLDLSWWKPFSVKTPYSWSLHEENNGSHYFEDWVIDEDSGVIFVSKRTM